MTDATITKLYYDDCIKRYNKHRIMLERDNGNFALRSSIVFDLRSIASLELRLNLNRDAFIKCIDMEVDTQIEIIHGYDIGKNVDPGFVTMTYFYIGLDAMATGNMEMGRKYYHLIGGRHKEEKNNDSKFMSSIGYAVKDLATSGVCSNERLASLEKYSAKPSIRGYAILIRGISSRDVDLANTGINEVIRGYKTCIRPGNIFHLTPDAHVFFWCAGLINISKSLGLNVSVPDMECLPQSLFK
jgi:hypothetical protein